MNLKEQIKKEQAFTNQINKWDKERKEILKEHKGFKNTTGNTDKKEIEKTEAFKQWKVEITAEYNQKISDLKDTLADLYIERKQQTLEDYPIFMAIAEKISYDATGKSIPDNELETIGIELNRFIIHIEKTEDY